MADGLLFSEDRSRGRRYDGKRMKRSKRARRMDKEGQEGTAGAQRRITWRGFEINSR